MKDKITITNVEQKREIMKIGTNVGNLHLWKHSNCLKDFSFQSIIIYHENYPENVISHKYHWKLFHPFHHFFFTNPSMRILPSDQPRGLLYTYFKNSLKVLAPLREWSQWRNSDLIQIYIIYTYYISETITNWSVGR